MVTPPVGFILGIVAKLVSWFSQRAYNEWLSETMLTLHALIKSGKGNMVGIEDEYAMYAARAVAEGYLAYGFPGTVTLPYMVTRGADL